MIQVLLLKLSDKKYFFNEFPKSINYIKNLNDAEIVDKITKEIQEIIDNAKIDNAEIFEKVDITNYIRSINFSNSDQELLSADISFILPIENLENTELLVGKYNIYANDFIIIRKGDKDIFYGFVDNINISSSVDSNIICNIKLYSFTHLLKTSSFVISESLINKIYTDFTKNKDELAASKEFFANIQSLTVWSDIFQDKTVMDIIRYVLKNKLFCDDSLLFNFKNFINIAESYTSKKILIPSFYLLFCMHYIKNGKKIIETNIEVGIKPYMNLLGNGFSMTDSIYKTPYDIIKDVCNVLLLEFFEDFGNTLFITQKYFIKHENNKETYNKLEILNKLNNIETNISNSTNSNIFVSTFVSDVIGPVSEFLNGVYYDHLSIYKNNFVYNNETYISPYNRSYQMLSHISKYKYTVDLVESSCNFNMSFYFRIDDDILDLKLNNIYHLYGESQYVKGTSVFVYPKNINISIGVDENIQYSISGNLFSFDPALFSELNNIINKFYSINCLLSGVAPESKGEFNNDLIVLVGNFINRNGISIMLNSNQVLKSLNDIYSKFYDFIYTKIRPVTAFPYVSYELKDDKKKLLETEYKKFLSEKIYIKSGDYVVLEKDITNPNLANDSEDVLFYTNKVVAKKDFFITVEDLLKNIVFVTKSEVSDRENYFSLFSEIELKYNNVYYKGKIEEDSFKRNIFTKEYKLEETFKQKRLEIIDLINQLIGVKEKELQKKNAKKEETKDITKR